MFNHFEHFSTAGTHVISVDPNGQGVFTNIVLERVVVNGGTAGAITLGGGDETDIMADIDPESGVPIVLEYGVPVHGDLIITMAANTDVTVVFRRIP